MGEVRRLFIIRKNSEAEEFEPVDLLLDSGATYSLIPSEILAKLGIAPHSIVEVVLADGSRMKRQLGDAHFEYQGEKGSAPVIFGEEGEEPLVGMVTLEALRLVLHPFRRELFPASAVRL